MENKIENSDIYAVALHHRFQWEEAQQSYVILFPEGMVKLHGGADVIVFYFIFHSCFLIHNLSQSESQADESNLYQKF